MYKSVVLGIFFLLISGTTSAQVSNPEGVINPTDDDDIWAQTLEGSHFNEFWTYHFYLNDGMKVHITFTAANFGNLKSAVSGAQFSIDRFNGELYQVSREYDLDLLVQDKETYMWRNRMARELYFVGKLPKEHKVYINTEKDNIQYNIELDLHNIQKGIKWGDGFYNIDGEKVGMYTHIPYAEVSGTIGVAGRTEKVSGTVYMDHTFQNETTTRLIHSGYRYAYQKDADNWDLIYIMMPENTNKNETIGYRLKNSDGDITLNGIERITQMTNSETFGEDLPRILELQLDNGDTIRLTRTADTEKFSVLGELGRFAKSVARRFLGGEIVHFRGDAVLMEQGQRPTHGYYHYLVVE
jgi:hypothetical protein